LTLTRASARKVVIEVRILAAETGGNGAAVADAAGGGVGRRRRTVGVGESTHSLNETTSNEFSACSALQSLQCISHVA
jgi:hypothetical protein